MKILVTGATGFIGHNLVKVLLDKDFEIHTIVRLDSNTSRIDNRAKIFKFNEDIDNLTKYFNEEKFNGVIHLASLFLAVHTTKDVSNLIRSNIGFGTLLLEASKISEVKWFINTGTFWQHYQKDDYNPVNLYAATKEAFEKIAEYYTQTSDLIFTTIKLNDTFGGNDTRDKVLNLWNKAVKTGKALEMSPGEQVIDISYIEDIISAYEKLTNHLNSKEANEFKNKTFAVKSGERVSLKELANIFEEATDTKLNIIWGAKQYREREVMVPWKDGKLIPNWQPKYNLRQAIKKMIGKKQK